MSLTRSTRTDSRRSTSLVMELFRVICPNAGSFSILLLGSAPVNPGTVLLDNIAFKRAK